MNSKGSGFVAGTEAASGAFPSVGAATLVEKGSK